MLAVVLVLLGVAGLTVLYRTEPGEGGWLPVCVFYKVTGFHCTGCGMTRALHALLHLRLDEAFRQNPLVMAALPLIVYGAVIEGLAWIMRERYRGPRVRMPGWAYTTLLVTVFAYWVLRNVPVWPFTLLAPH